MASFWRSFGVAVVVCLVVASAQLLAQSPDPTRPFFGNVTAGGSGCPQNSVAVQFEPDRLSFSLIFDAYIAHSGPGVPATEHRKSCQIAAQVHLPENTGRFCAAFVQRGTVNLPPGLTAESRSVYRNGLPDPSGQDPHMSHGVGTGSAVFEGPVAGDHQRQDFADVDLAKWAPFPPTLVPLRATTELLLQTPGNVSAMIAMDSFEGRLTPCAVEDTTAPTITIDSPVHHGLYGLGASVSPVFSCQDEVGGSGLASCTGPALLDTSSIGPRTFTVTAVDNAGNTSTASVSYAVGGKDECRASGHARFLAPRFKNQGQCVSSFVP